VIGKVCRRGTDVRRLLGYLFLEGQAGERGLASDHHDAHVVAGYQDTGLLQPPRRPDGRFDVDRLGGLLNAPVLAGGVGKDARPVYHLAISAAKTDRLLSDREWGDIAQEYLHRIGLAPRGDDEAVRWVAVRHAPDHIHVVATLVRQDGRRVFPRQDFLRSREASRPVEDRYGLTTTAPVGGTSTPETTRAEWRKHRQETDRRHAQGRPAPAGPDRQVLRGRVQDAACTARSWEEFTGRLGRDGVLVRARFSTVNPGEITGYAVALRPVGRDLDEDRQPVWFGGGKLAPDLTLPRLRQRWQQDATDDGSRRPDEHHNARRPAAESAERLSSGRLLSLTDSERRDLWLAAQRAVQQAQHALQAATVTRGAGRDSSAQAEAMAAAMGASDVLHAVSRLIEGKCGGPLRDAAEHYDRASRPPRGRVPAATPASRALRAAARGMRTAGVAKNRDTRQLLQLMTQLAGLAETVARLRETQQQAARASAARQAAEQLLHHVSAVGAAPATGTGRDRAAYFPQALKTDQVVPGRPPAPTRATAADPRRGHAPRGR
jgi:hypothetical protein